MYIENSKTYYTNHGQKSTRANFLILVQSEDRPLGPNNFRGLVRKVVMRQCGNWMMGTARVANESLTLSGAYGGDGLPKTVSEKIFEKGTPVPKALYDAWDKGGGWNSCGSEADAMRAWALKEICGIAIKEAVC